MDKSWDHDGSWLFLMWTEFHGAVPCRIIPARVLSKAPWVPGFTVGRQTPCPKIFVHHFMDFQFVFISLAMAQQLLGQS